MRRKFDSHVAQTSLGAVEQLVKLLVSDLRSWGAVETGFDTVQLSYKGSRGLGASFVILANLLYQSNGTIDRE